MEKKPTPPARTNRLKKDRRTLPGPRFNDVEGIIRSAVTCFGQYGVAKTSLEDVAREAGISRPLLYLFFSNRQTLIDAVINSEIARLVELQFESMRGYKNFVEAIVKGSCLAVEIGRSNTLLKELMAYGSVEHVPELLLDPDKPAHQIVLRLWQPIFEKARQTGELRKDLKDDDIMEWLMSVHYAFLLRDHVSEERMTELITLFFVPSLGSEKKQRR